MKVVGYSYDAAVHCPSCTFKYARAVEYSDYQFGEYSDEDITVDFAPGIIDVQKAIELEIIRDSESNMLHPVFDTDESGDTPEHCDDCGEYIDTSWSGETVDYAVEALKEYVDRDRGNESVLDIWAEHLKWCHLSEEDVDTIATYEILREKEKSGQA